MKDMQSEAKWVILSLLVQLSLIVGWACFVYTSVSSQTEGLLLLGLFVVTFFLRNREELDTVKQLTQDIIYSHLVVPFSTQIYGNFLKGVEPNSKILDIGIGNAKALINNADLVREKNLFIYGCDINPPTVQIGNENIREAKLEKHATIKLQDVFEYETNEKYDYVVFSDCWALIPPIKDMVLLVRKWVRKGGKIVIVTTLEDRITFWKKLVKPNVKYVLGRMNDFGRCTTKKEMDDFLQENFTNFKNEMIYYKKYNSYGEIKSYKVSITCVQ
eukprot:TRINITY_DN283_c0_g1_i1.p1 TRINITY_DN283_c0_g1~~TRINITY_DN283_c0_g1_i1.p1  ORF type:complete len:273 (-),score=30.31 TRINITY_DN283_c0_g1_i1:65-883(-)